MSRDDPLGADDAATPLTPEEREGLIPAYITYRHKLNAHVVAPLLAFARS